KKPSRSRPTGSYEQLMDRPASLNGSRCLLISPASASTSGGISVHGSNTSKSPSGSKSPNSSTGVGSGVGDGGTSISGVDEQAVRNAPRATGRNRRTGMGSPLVVVGVRRVSAPDTLRLRKGDEGSLPGGNTS